MKLTSVLISSLCTLVLTILNTSCQKSDAAVAKSEPAAPENGAQFKKGEGLSITDEMKSSIGLKVEDVSEEKIGSSIAVKLMVLDPHNATAWVSPAEAGKIKLGMRVLVQNGSDLVNGTVERLEMPAMGGGDAELIVKTDSELPAAQTLNATLAHPESAAVAVIPASALLKTAEGNFAYAVNGKFFVRTPVTVGAANDRLVEITDGLYAGDQVVTTPVMSLWMAELQVLRGGKACTCGH